MAAKVHSGALTGLEGHLIEIEVDTARGFSEFHIVGMADKAIQESKQRLIAALRNAGFESPLKHAQRVVINLAPAWLKKEGSLYDLPIAIAYLMAKKILTVPLKGKLFVGELALDGSVRPVNGIVPLTLFAKQHRFTELYIPHDNCHEARMVKGVMVYGVTHLKELFDHLMGVAPLEPLATALNSELERGSLEEDNEYDFKYIKGQPFAKRAALIAAAGNHHLLFQGPPGVGKTFLAKGIASILPLLDDQELLEVASLYSIAGLFSESMTERRIRPFRMPHHSASAVALVGGGAHPRPGEISLSHRGVLFLDEFTEFSRPVIEGLRQPLEDKEVTVSRARAALKFPANFLLVAAINPCPCGYYKDPEKECRCTYQQIERYRKKLSGPIMDRFDLQVVIERVPFRKIDEEFEAKESSMAYREKVVLARARQADRLKGSGVKTNGDLTSQKIKKYCVVAPEAKKILEQLADKYRFSPRGIIKTIKVAQTIADLANSDTIDVPHMLEAVNFKPKDDDDRSI